MILVKPVKKEMNNKAKNKLKKQKVGR